MKTPSRSGRGPGAVLVLALLASLPAAGTTARAPSGEILFGMSTALSGPAADLGRNMLQGVRAGFERANRDGGVKGRKLRVVALDDGYEPARTAPNMRRLIERERVVGVIGNVGTPTAIAAVPIAIELKTLFYAPFTGAGVLRRTPPDRYVVNYRASYAEETASMVDALIEVAGLEVNEVAFFTQRDGYGDAGFVGGITALKRHGLTDETAVTHARYERNTLAIENALADILLAEPAPRAIIMVGAYAPCAKFIKLAKQAGLDALFLNVSFVGSAPLARELGPGIDGVIVTQVVPHPLDTLLPAVAQYHPDLHALDATAAPTFGGLEGYIAARILLKALARIEGAVTSDAIVAALEGLGAFELGLGTPLHLSPEEHQASHRVWPTVLRDGAFVPFDWTAITAILGGG